MATNWDREMQDKFDTLQRALTDEFRTQFAAMGGQLEQRLQTQIVTMGGQLEERLQTQIVTMGGQLEERLSHRLQVQTEDLREIVRTAADNYGGVLDGIHRALRDLNLKVDLKFGDHGRVLADHNGRLNALEGGVFPDRTG